MGLNRYNTPVILDSIVQGWAESNSSSGNQGTSLQSHKIIPSTYQLIPTLGPRSTLGSAGPTASPSVS